MIIESRSLAEAPEFRAEGKQLVATGVAIRYNALSKDLGGFIERCLPGCATKTIAERDVRAVFNHDESAYLGRRSNNTLRFANDETALRYDVDLPDTAAGRETAYLLERRDLKGSSFRFGLVQKPQWSKTDSGQVLRSLPEIALFHVSPVFTPAYDDTEAALRSFAEERGLAYDEVREAAEGGQLVELVDIEHRTEPTKRRLHAVGAPAKRSDSDADPVALAQAVDAALDEATDLWADVDVTTLPPEVAQAIALVTAAETTVDQLLDVLGIYDADDDDDAPGQSDSDDVDSPDSAPMGPMPGYLTV